MHSLIRNLSLYMAQTNITHAYLHIYTHTWVWFEINVKVAFMIAIDGPCYSWPWSLHTQMARHTGAHQLMTLEQIQRW